MSPLAKTIPEMLFMAYQMTFAVIAVALVGGAVADRLKFSAFAVVSVFWLFLFGFNGGSALAVGSRAVFAIVATHFSACAGAVVWSAIEWKHRGKPSVLGVISGAVAGLGAITPASGYVLPWQGALIGAIAGGVCYFASTSVKQRFGYDDTLNVFGLHGVGGVLGTLLAGVFATASVSAGGGDPGVSGLWQGNAHQFALQIVGVAVTLVWCGIGAWISLKLTSALVGLRVSVDEEREGLDVSQRGEAMGA